MPLLKPMETKRAAIPPQFTEEHDVVMSSAQSTGEATHVVRLNVVGFSGIQVDRRSGWSSGIAKSFPRPPNKMKAVLAVSHGEDIQMTTPPSLPLMKENERQPDHAGGNRYLALWNPDNHAVSGTLVEFEVALNRLRIGNGRLNTYQYMPKNFSLVAALTEDTEHERKVALPIGVSDISIDGNRGDEIWTLDLPMRSLNQAHILEEGKSSGHHQFQKMISILDRNFLEDGTMYRKKKQHRRRLKEKNNLEKSQKVPSVADRRRFSSFYSAVTDGGAMLRVQMQVIEKQRPRQEVISSVASSTPWKELNYDYIEVSKLLRNISLPNPSKTVRPRPRHFPSNQNKDQGTAATEVTDSDTMTSDGSPATNDAVSYPKTSLSTSLRNASPPKQSQPAPQHSNGNWSEELTENSIRASLSSQSRNGSCKHHHRKLPDGSWIPSCGGAKIPYADDMTMVTGDFFGRELRFPICSSMKQQLRGADTCTSENEDILSDDPRQGSTMADMFGCSEQTRHLHNRVGEVLAKAERALGKFMDDEEQFDEPTFVTEDGNFLETSEWETVEDIKPNKTSAICSSSQRAKDSEGCDNIETNRNDKLKQSRQNAQGREHFLACGSISKTSEMSCHRKYVRPCHTEGCRDPKILKEPLVDIGRQKVEASRTFQMPGIFGSAGWCTGKDFEDDDDLELPMKLLPVKQSSLDRREFSQLTQDETFASLSMMSAEENYFDDYDYYALDSPQSRVTGQATIKGLA